MGTHLWMALGVSSRRPGTAVLLSQGGLKLSARRGDDDDDADRARPASGNVGLSINLSSCKHSLLPEVAAMLGYHRAVEQEVRHRRAGVGAGVCGTRSLPHLSSALPTTCAAQGGDQCWDLCWTDLSVSGTPRDQRVRPVWRREAPARG